MEPCTPVACQMNSLKYKLTLCIIAKLQHLCSGSRFSKRNQRIMLALRQPFITIHSASYMAVLPLSIINFSYINHKKPHHPLVVQKNNNMSCLIIMCLRYMQTFHFHSVPVASFHFEYSFTSTPTLHFTSIYCIHLSTARLR